MSCMNIGYWTYIEIRYLFMKKIGENFWFQICEIVWSEKIGSTQWGLVIWTSLLNHVLNTCFGFLCQN